MEILQLLSEQRCARIACGLAVSKFSFYDWEILTTMCKLPTVAARSTLSFKYRVNYIQCHCPSKETHFKLAKIKAAVMLPWPWVTCFIHRGTSLLLWSHQQAMRRELVRVWHTAAHTTAEAKCGSPERNKHNESQSWMAAGGKLVAGYFFQGLEYISFKWKR